VRAGSSVQRVRAADDSGREALARLRHHRRRRPTAEREVERHGTRTRLTAGRWRCTIFIYTRVVTPVDVRSPPLGRPSRKMMTAKHEDEDIAVAARGGHDRGVQRFRHAGGAPTRCAASYFVSERAASDSRTFAGVRTETVSGGHGPRCHRPLHATSCSPISSAATRRAELEGNRS